MKGCTMSTICANAYTNTFMTDFESKNIYIHIIKDKINMFLRFIDDLFIIWTGSKQELLEFMSDLNKKHPLIKLEFKYSQTTIELLDVLFDKDQNNMLQTTTYRKQTD